MHELSLCQSLVDLIEEQALQQRFDRVTKVVLEIGALSHVEPEAIAFSFESAARGSKAEAATLEIREPAGAAYCVDCEDTVEIARRGEGCPRCGGSKLMVTGGDEMQLKELEVL